MRAEDFLDGASSTAPMSAEDFLGPNDSGSKPPKQNTGIVGDIGTALKRGVLQMPGMATGLADIAAAPVSIATGVNRPVSRAAEWLGEQTGFQPGKWAEAAGAEYSPEMQQAQQNVEQAKGFFPTLGAVAQNPRVAAQVVAESLPSTIAGGLVARGAMGAVAGAEKLAALRTAAGSADAAVANAARRELLKSGAIAAGVGEGAVTAGQQMAQTGYDVDPALATGAAIGAGVGTGIIGGLSGRVASSALGRKLGLSDIETSMAAGTFGENAGKAGTAGYARRIGAGAIQEGLLEEAPQSYQEQVWQNLAAGKPLTEGAAEAAALGAVAGGVMGGGVNIASGPLSKAVAAAPGAGVPPAVPVPDAGIQPQAPVPDAGIASAAQFPQFTAPPQPVTGGAPLEQAPTAMPVPQATQNAPAAPGSPSPVSAADPLPSAKQAEAAGAPIQQPQGPLPSANQTEVAIPPAQGPEAAALPVATKPAKGIAAASIPSLYEILDYQSVGESGSVLHSLTSSDIGRRVARTVKAGDPNGDEKLTLLSIAEINRRLKIDSDVDHMRSDALAKTGWSAHRAMSGAELPNNSPGLQYPQQVTEGGWPLAQQAADMPIGRFGDRQKTADISPDIPAKKATRIASSSGIAGALVTPQQPTFGGAPLEQSPVAMPLGEFGKRAPVASRQTPPGAPQQPLSGAGEGDAKTGEEAIRAAAEAVPNRTIGSWYPINVTFNGKTQPFLSNIKRVVSDGKTRPSIILVQIRRGRMLAGDPLQPLFRGYRLSRDNKITDEGIVRPASDAEVARWNKSFPENQVGIEDSTTNPLSGAGEQQTVDRLQSAYNEAKAKLEAIGPEPRKPSTERQAFGTKGKSGAPADVVAKYEASVKAYVSWKAKYNRLKKAEVETSNALFAAKKAEPQPKPRQQQESEIDAHNTKSIKSEQFAEALANESVGGNAGDGRSGVNITFDKAGKIVAIGNYQQLAEDVRLAIDSGKLRRATLLVSNDLRGSSPNKILGAYFDSGTVEDEAKAAINRLVGAVSGQERAKPRQQPQPAPIMRRDDLVGAIMRVTGGDGIASNMALTIAGDTAGRGLSKLRGLFTNRGTIDLGEVATRLREDEGFDVRDGEHLSELIRAASFGDTAVSMERAERDQDAAEEKRHRDYIRQNAKKLKIKSVAVKFTDLEQRVIAALTRRHERAVELLDERAKKRFDAALEESYALLPEDVVDAVLVDVNGRGLKTLEFWKEATKLLRYMVADAKAQKEQEELNAIEGAEPDWLKDDDGRGNKPAGGGGEVDRVAEEARGEAYSIGDEITFTPHPERRLDSEVSGILVAKESTGSGRFRLRIRTDRPSPQGDGFVTLQVYSQNGSVQKIGDGLNADQPSSFGLAAQTPEEIAAAEAAAKEAKQAEAAAAAAEARKEKAAQDKAEKDRRAAEVLKEREAAKKAEVDKAAEEFALGQVAPEPVVKKVTTEEAAGQKDIFAAPAAVAKQPDENERIRDLVSKTSIANYGDVFTIAGDRNSSVRQEIMSAILGKKATKAESGVTAIRDALWKLAGATGGTTASKDDALRDWIAGNRASGQVQDLRFSQESSQDNQPAFYSQLSSAIASARVTSQPAAQWKAWINGNAGNLGIKKDEIEWSGVNDWLDMMSGGARNAASVEKEYGADSPFAALWKSANPAKITKQQVLDYLSGNGVRVEDVVKGGETELSIDQAESALRRGEQVHAVERTKPDRVVGITFDDGVTIIPYVKKNHERYIFRLGSFREAVNRDVGTKFDGYWQDSYKGGIPGTYREILVTLPASRKGMKVAQHPNRPEGYAIQNQDGSYLSSKSGTVVYFHIREAAEDMIGSQPDKAFRSNHWDEPNVLVHIRTDEVIGADGKRYLRVGEIQSDWGQKGKKEGFHDAEKLHALNLKAVRGTITTEERKTLEELRKQSQQSNIPPAPFVTDTRAWAALGIKRAIIHAINSGVDGVVFGTGEQNANLYDLSKQVQSIAWTGRGNDTEKIVTITVNSGNDIEFRLMPDGTTASMSGGQSGDEFAGKRLDDIVGKDVSDRIMSAPYGDMRGNGLKVGGEGMRAFYDQIIPSVANDVLKKVGGGKVEAVRIDGADYGKTGRTEEKAKYAAFVAQPGFAITPQMRAKIQSQGVPLFSFAGQQSATADQFQIDRAKQLLADGANANSVRQQTGWFKNPSDGKWRYEIDDSGASLKAHGFGFGELLDALGKNLTLAEVLDHPALFAAYPSIARSSVEAIDEKSQNNGELVTNKDGGFTIRVNAGLGEAKALSVMLHEIQHGIQNVEGFASGGSPRTISAEMTGRSDDLAKAGSALNSAITAVRSANGNQAYRDILAAVRADGYRYSHIAFQLGTIDDDLSDVAMLVSEIAKKKGYKELFDAAEAYSVIADNLIKPGQGIDRDKAAYEKYRKLAGEVESRNVQQRQNFPADKRKYSDPLGTQDVAPEDVIVMFNGKDAKDAPAPANTTRASAMAAVGASPADAAVFDMASEGRSAQEILTFLSKASRRPFNRVLAAALSRIGVASTVSIDPAAGWRNSQNRQGARFAASYSPKTDTVSLFTPREAERHILHELVHAATLKAIARGGPAARQMQAIFDYVQRTGTMSDQYGMGNFARFQNETDAQFKKRALDEFTAELFTNPQFQVRLKQLPAPSGSKLKSAWDWIVRVIANLLGLKTKAQETALDRALSVGAALLQENAALTMPPVAGTRYHTTWHGSPHKFYTFDLSKIGTGEGAQAYGHGLYVADAPEVAENYRNPGGPRSGTIPLTIDGIDASSVARSAKQNSAEQRAADALSRNRSSIHAIEYLAQDAGYDKTASAAIEWIQNNKSRINDAPGSSLYKVDLPAEAVARMLDWDKKLSEQSQVVQKAWNKFLSSPAARSADKSLRGDLFNKVGQFADPTGEQIHNTIAEGLIGYGKARPFNQVKEEATKRLHKSGVPGIRYLDQQSRSGEKATSNFVLFDDKLARIIEVNGVETGVQPWAPGEWETTQGGERFSQEQPFSGREVAATPLKPGTKTLVVDGVERPALNSNGKPIHWSEEGVRNFWRWFGESKVVDEQGRPLVVYHGTKGDFASFSKEHLGKTTSAESAKKGFFFAKSKETAAIYALHADQIEFRTESEKWRRDALLSTKHRFDAYTAIKDQPGVIKNRPGDPLAISESAPEKTKKLFSEFLSAKAKERQAKSKVDEFFNKSQEKQLRLIAGSELIEDDINEQVVYPVYLSIKNPARHDFKNKEYRDESFNDLLIGAKEIGNDGALFANVADPIPGDAVFVALDTNQIKSATGNTGAFSPEDPDIRYSLATNWQQSPVAREVAKSFDLASRSDKKLSWLNPVQTQYHKAERLAADGKPLFKRVFDLGQKFLNDISRFAVMAENAAPTLFHQIKSIADVRQAAGEAIRGDFGKQRNADIRAIAAPLYEGTLYGGGNPMSGVVWNESQLRQKFNLTDRQITLYQEAREAVKVSMDEMAKSLIARHAKREKVMVDSSLSLNDVADEVSNALNLRATVFKDDAEAAHDEAMQQVKDLRDAGQDKRADADEKIADAKLESAMKEVERIGETVKDIKSIADKASKLQEAGYFPLMRFGRHKVTAKDADGKVQHFSMHDGIPLVPRSGQIEANRLADALRDEHPDWTVETGLMNPEQYKLYQGMNVDALQLFADHLDEDTKQTYQEIIRLATNERSALKRMIKREGTPGFDKDVRRTLASFILSNARYTSSSYHLSDMTKAAELAEKDGGDIGAEAVKLVDYITKPQEEAAKIRGFLFFNFLGGSIAAAMVNATQIPMMTFPRLSQYEPAAKLATRLARVAKMAMLDPAKVPGDIGYALRRAEEDGITAPHQIYELTGTASNNIFSGSRGANAIMRAWGAPFALAESFNRRATFLASYEIAKAMTPAQLQAAGATDAYEFAAKMIAETQGIYNRGNRVNVGRGALGATVMTFKQYSIMYMEMLSRMPPKQQAIMVGMLLLAAGAGGLPFAEDAEDIIDTIGQWMGYRTNTKRTIRNALTGAIGQTAADVTMNGLLSRIGVDLHSRLGLHNILPGSALLKPSTTDKSREFQDLLGPAASVVASLGQAMQSIAEGKPGRAALTLAPVAIQNAVKGWRMGDTGRAEDMTGKPTIPVSASESVAKGIGFNPKAMADYGAAKRDILQDERLLDVWRERFTADIVQAVVAQDAEALQKARQAVADWNARHPDGKIAINPASIRRRVAELRTEGPQRVLKSLTPALRQQARQELYGAQ